MPRWRTGVQTLWARCAEVLFECILWEVFREAVASSSRFQGHPLRDIHRGIQSQWTPGEARCRGNDWASGEEEPHGLSSFGKEGNIAVQIRGLHLHLSQRRFASWGTNDASFFKATS